MALVRSELRSLPVISFCVAAVLVAGVIPIVSVMVDADSYSLLGRVDLFALIMRKSPMTLLFPLIVALPYAIALSQQISHRYLLYVRPVRTSRPR